MCDVLEFVAKKTILRKGFQKTDKYGNQNQVYDHFQTSGSDQAIEKEGNIEGEQENKSVKEERQGNKVQRKGLQQRKRMVKERRRKRKRNIILKDKERNKLRMRASKKIFQPNGLDLTNQT